MGDLNTWIGGAVPVIVAAGGLGVGGVMLNRYKTWKDDRQKTRTDSLSEWKEISARDQARITQQDIRITQLENDMRSMREDKVEQIRDANDRAHDWQLKYERATSHIRYVTSMCEGKGIALLHYDPDASTLHTPLPADGKRTTT